NTFNFDARTNKLSLNLKLEAGKHIIKVSAKNECGDASQTVEVEVKKPCQKPQVKFSVNEIASNVYTHSLEGVVTNLENKSQISVSIDGRTDNTFNFDARTNKLSLNLKLEAGKHIIKVSAKNECGDASQTVEVIVNKPCESPSLRIELTETKENNFTHVLSGYTKNIERANEITITVDGSNDNSFSFSANTGIISDKYNFSAGTHVVQVNVKNECGNASDTKRIVIKEEACGPRFSLGNAEWEFCLITKKGTFNRSDLKDGFSYSGAASALYFKATAGGGDAIVAGKPYSISSDKYYLFTGDINVKVGTNNPGSIGSWSVCIETNKAPQSGIGNTRPKSPCESSGGGNKDDGNKVRDDINVKVNDRPNNSGKTENNSSTKPENNKINVDDGRNQRPGTNVIVPKTRDNKE
ncbi:MAG: hypothetical protein PHE33_06830, partial [Bacteroidales bacterium]|nr:hypothetical protein [Bacteroidales bacterium]